MRRVRCAQRRFQRPNGIVILNWKKRDSSVISPCEFGETDRNLGNSLNFLGSLFEALKMVCITIWKHKNLSSEQKKRGNETEKTHQTISIRKGSASSSCKGSEIIRIRDSHVGFYFQNSSQNSIKFSVKRGPQLVRDCLTPFSRQSNDETGSSESPDMKKDDEFYMKCTTCHVSFKVNFWLKVMRNNFSNPAPTP